MPYPSQGRLDALVDWVERNPELLEPGPAQLLMHVAARRGRRELVDWLLERGALVDVFTLAWLGEHGVDVHARDRKGRTALHCATRVGYTRVLELLIEAGADVNAHDADGATPLDYVDRARPSADRAATAEVLRRHGARSGG